MRFCQRLRCELMQSRMRIAPFFFNLHSEANVCSLRHTVACASEHVSCQLLLSRAHMLRTFSFSHSEWTRISSFLASATELVREFATASAAQRNFDAERRLCPCNAALRGATYGTP